LILVIDDDRDTLQLLKLALHRAGYSVLLAANGEEVQQCVQANYEQDKPIDLIVLDLMMPEQSGFDILRSLHVVLVPLPPVIMLTAITGMQQRLEARDLGAAKYLTKPTTPKLLVETIQEVLTQTQKGKSGKPIDKFPAKRFSR
jgi:DNA-binding response OmpR family regulator